MRTALQPHFHIGPCAHAGMFERLLDLRDGFLVRAANMSVEELRARFQRCPGAFHCVLRRAQTDDEMVVATSFCFE